MVWRNKTSFPCNLKLGQITEIESEGRTDVVHCNTNEQLGGSIVLVLLDKEFTILNIVRITSGGRVPRVSRLLIALL